MKKERRIRKDAKVLNAFVRIYCRKNHHRAELREDCRALLDYAMKRDEHCPLDPKPKCKDCKIHCYKPEMREKISRIMKFSGIYYIKRGRLDWLIHYFF